MFTFPYCPHLGRIFLWFLSLFCPLLFPVVFQPHLPTRFPFLLCFEIVLMDSLHFQKCFPYFKCHFNLSLLPRKLPPGTHSSQRNKFGNSFLLCLTVNLVNIKQLFLDPSGCLGERLTGMYLMLLCLTDQYQGSLDF